MFLFLFLVPVFLYAVTMLIFQIKRIISNKTWFNYVVTFFFENAKNLGRSDDAKGRKKKRMAETFKFRTQNLKILCFILID